MRTALFALVAVSLIVVGFGCSVGRTPVTYSLFADVQGNLQASPAEIPAELKVGTATATSIIGIATGDCSIDAAMKSQQIKKVYYVDYHTRGILGLWAETTTKVYGE